MNDTIMLGTISLHNMAGGLERNFIYLANYLVSTGRKVVLLTFDFPDASSFFEIDSRVIWVKVGATKPHTKTSLREKFRLVGLMRKTIRQHQVRQIICFTHGLLTRFLTAAFGLKIKTICTERNSLTIYDFTSYRKWSLNFWLLCFVDKIAVQFDAYKSDYPFWIRHKIITIHNPIFTPKSYTDFSNRTILAVGRLTPQKRFDLIIKAFAITANTHSDWRLKIVGAGPLHDDLMAFIKSLGVADIVSISAPTKSIANIYKDCCIFASASQWEGFPNALAEALSCGLLGVGFSQTAGVSHLIRDGFNGALAHGDTTAQNFSNALNTLIERQADWHSMSENAVQILETYSVDIWQDAWRKALGY